MTMTTKELLALVGAGSFVAYSWGDVTEPEPANVTATVQKNVAALCAEVEALRKDAERLRLFALDVLDDWPDCAPDGGDLQDMAIKHGLLERTPNIVPCREDCACAEFYDEGQEADCYHRAKFLTTPPAIDAAKEPK